MVQQILAVFEVIKEVIALVKGAVALYRQAKREGWYEDGRALAKKIKEADTDEKRRALVRELAGHPLLP